METATNVTLIFPGKQLSSNFLLNSRKQIFSGKADPYRRKNISKKWDPHGTMRIACWQNGQKFFLFAFQNPLERAKKPTRAIHLAVQGGKAATSVTLGLTH